MKKISQYALAALVTAVAPMSAFGLNCYVSTFEDENVPGAWNWSGNAATTNTASIVDYNGSKWRQMESAIKQTGGDGTGNFTSGRYGYKMDMTLTGNTSTNPADYFVEFDAVNLSGNWTTVNLGVALMTKVNTAGTAGHDYGHSSPTIAVPQGSVVHCKWKLSELTGNWWDGTDWLLTHPNWSYEINMPETAVPAGGSWTQKILIDNFRIVLGSIEAFKPSASPVNTDGTSGELVSGSLTSAKVTLGWNAGVDTVISNYALNPNIYGYYIYLSRGDVAEPNFLDMTLQVHDADPALTDPINSYGPVTVKVSDVYTWRVDEAIKYPNGQYSAKNDPNTIKGALWKFTSVAADAAVVSGPAHVLADASGNAKMTVIANSASTSYAWFKVGSPDVQITDGGVYSGATTATLTFTGATAAAEGKYYAIAYNSSGKASSPSASAKLWTRRLMSHFTFDTISNGISPDSVSGFNATMLNFVPPVGSTETAGDGTLPSLTTGMTELGASDKGLNFPNTAATVKAYANASAGLVDYKDITISAWVFCNGGGNWQRIIDCGVDTNNNIYITPKNGDGNTDFTIRKGGTDYKLTTPRFAEGAWTLVTATLNGNTARLYINGELKATNTNVPADPVDLACTNYYIGRSHWSDPYFNGIISDLKIYSYARTTNEIAQDYLAIKGGWVCNRELYNLPYDFDNNCQVDVLDIAKFAATWMNTYRIYPN